MIDGLYIMKVFSSPFQSSFFHYWPLWTLKSCKRFWLSKNFIFLPLVSDFPRKYWSFFPKFIEMRIFFEFILWILFLFLFSKKKFIITFWKFMKLSCWKAKEKHKKKNWHHFFTMKNRKTITIFGVLNKEMSDRECFKIGIISSFLFTVNIFFTITKKQQRKYLKSYEKWWWWFIDFF